YCVGAGADVRVDLDASADRCQSNEANGGAGADGGAVCDWAGDHLLGDFGLFGDRTQVVDQSPGSQSDSPGNVLSNRMAMAQRRGARGNRLARLLLSFAGGEARARQLRAGAASLEKSESSYRPAVSALGDGVSAAHYLLVSAAAHRRA